MSTAPTLSLQVDHGVATLNGSCALTTASSAVYQDKFAIQQEAQMAVHTQVTNLLRVRNHLAQ